MNAQKQLGDIVEIMDYHGEEYMFYRQIPIDVCIIQRNPMR